MSTSAMITSHPAQEFGSARSSGRAMARSATESTPELRPHPVRIPLGPDVLVILRRYESLRLANDVLLEI